MKILTAIDSFKGSFTSQEANHIVAEAFKAWSKVTDVLEIPIADGGEGTMEVLLHHFEGEYRQVQVPNLAGREVTAKVGWVAEKRWAILEVAEVVGVQFLDGSSQTHPSQTNTQGLGHLIQAALDLGAQRLIIGLGGTGTIDLGWGLATALGARFMNKSGVEVPPLPGHFFQVDRIDLSGLAARLTEVQWTLLNDVTTPLLGPTGVVQLLGRQKGLKEAEFAVYEQGAHHFAMCLAKEDHDTPGDGAAGGIGWMLRQLCGATYVPGFQFIADTLDLRRRMAECDLVITGEGRLDAQSLIGKVPIGIAGLAKDLGKPCLAFTGKNNLTPEQYQFAGLTEVIPIVDQVMSLEAAMTQGPSHLARAAQRVVTLMQVSDALREIR